MSMFGWSLPAGCTGTPYDEAYAEELKVPALPERVTAFWVDGETVEIQRFHADGEPETLLRFEYLGDDDLDEAQNSAAAAEAAAQEWQAYVDAGYQDPVLRIRMRPNDARPGWLVSLGELGCKATYNHRPFGRTAWLVTKDDEAIEVVQAKSIFWMTKIDKPTAKQREIAAALATTGIAVVI